MMPLQCFSSDEVPTLMHLSLITSLYRSDAYLPAYGQRIQRVLSQLEQMGVSAEILVIANDPTPTERTLLAGLPIRLIETERESLYASWNRGIAAMQSDIFGAWNVDDERDASALVEGYQLMQAGHTLVDMPMLVIQSETGLFARTRQFVRAPLIHEPRFTRKHGLNTFMLIHRRLFDTVGVFDSNFRIMGDLEWASRAQQQANIGITKQVGGTFYLHGSNLSGTGSTREMIETNIVFLRRQQWDEVRPTPDPKAMREAWDTWGNAANITVPADLAARLWGENAQDEWVTWQRNHARQQRRLKWATRARTLADRLGLRPLLRRVRQSGAL